MEHLYAHSHRMEDDDSRVPVQENVRSRWVQGHAAPAKSSFRPILAAKPPK